MVDSGRDSDPATLDALGADLDPEDAINIQFTSGTTGAPKGAMLGRVNIVNNGRFVVGDHGTRPVVYSGAALPACFDGDGQSRLRDHRRSDGLLRRLRCGFLPARPRRRTLHRGLWRADHVRRHVAASRD